jgi:processive 1,2-diacylglycerol beta-glucosyltransferase
MPLRLVRRPRPDVLPSGAPRGRVVILSATVGQGHEGAARELARRLEVHGVATEVHDFLDALPAFVRHTLREGYHPTVQHAPAFFDWLFDGLEHKRWLGRVGDLVCRTAETTVLDWTRGADVVVSTYPLASQTLGQLRGQGALTAPAVTFLTDPAAHRLWCHPDVDRHLTVTQATADDGARYGVDLQAVGPLCAPRFSRSVPGAARDRLRAELGLPGTAPVVLLSAGSLGMGDIPDTVDAVLRHPEARLVVLCGRNAPLRRRLAALPRVVALGWRDDVPELMAAADVLVHNAGGLSFTEALVAGLPAVTYLPIPGHGRANADLLARAAMAPWPRDPDELVAAIDEILARPRPVLGPRAATADPATVVAELVARRLAANRPVPRPESA